jgi:hypothetical protein
MMALQTGQVVSVDNSAGGSMIMKTSLPPMSVVPTSSGSKQHMDSTTNHVFLKSTDNGVPGKNPDVATTSSRPNMKVINASNDDIDMVNPHNTKTPGLCGDETFTCAFQNIYILGLWSRI